MGRTLPHPHGRTIVAVSLACLLLAALGTSVPGAAARNVNFTLYGSRNGGWGFTNVSLTIPGPEIAVGLGDNVTLNLTSLDLRNHIWFIDYNNNSNADVGEPQSQPFGLARLWNFTADRNGTFIYRSAGRDAGTMWGNITIGPAGTGSPSGLDTASVAIVGLVVLGIAVVAIALLFRRRPRPPELPPPPPDE